MGLTVPPQDPSAVATGDMLAAVSTAMVQIYKELWGRGPTDARTWFAGPDVLLTLLGDSLTAGERKLVDLGQADRLRSQRTFVQYASSDLFRGAVEEISGRQVKSFVSGIDSTSGQSTEVFVLEPVALAPA